MIYLLITIATFVIFSQGVGYALSGPRYKGPVTDHFDGKKFINPGNVKAKGPLDVLRWMIQRKQGEWKRDMTIAPGPRPETEWKDGIRVTFVNHSTFLLQFDGVNVLTDPVWSDRVSPFSFVGPQRMRPPGILFEELPRIDVVLLSHNHYDHLDVATVKELTIKFNPVFVVPLGVDLFLKTKGINNTIVLDWWQAHSYNPILDVQAVPAQHFSGRGTLDRDGTLWCGFVLKRKEGNIYFAADSGYNAAMFREIGERCEPKISIIPIGAYKPEWFMSPVHCSPSEAVQIHLDLQSKQSIATHYGTFPLADEGEKAPVLDLKRSMKERSLAENEFVALQEGVATVFR